MSRFIPDRKVWAGGLAGLISWGLVAALGRYGITLTPDQSLMLSGMIVGAVQYITPPSTWDIIKRLNDSLVKVAADDPRVPVSQPVAKS